MSEENDTERWIWTVGTVEEDGIESVCLESGKEDDPLVVDMSSKLARRIGNALIAAANRITTRTL